MRLNYFLGIDTTFHYVIDLMKDDPRVASPCVVNLKSGEGWKDPVRRVGVSDEILSFMFEDISKQECNVALPMNRDTGAHNLLKNASPRGSRFWFILPKDIEKYIDEHIKFFESVKNDKLILIKHTFEVGSFNKRALVAQCYDLSKCINEIADQWGAMPTTDFNLQDYFEDSNFKSTEFTVRKYIKR